MGMLSDLFGDNHKAYDKYGNEIEGLAGQYDPYIKDGKKMLSDLTNKGQWMTNSPWALEDEMQSHYNESPGFKYSQNQLTNRMNNNAALTGQLGNGAENASLQSALEGRLNQNMGQYVDRGINTFNNGINTESNINNMGFNALGQKNQLMQGAYGSDLQGDLSHDNAMQHMLGFGLNLGSKFLFGKGLNGLGDAAAEFGSDIGSMI